MVMNLEINNRKKNVKSTNTWRLNNTLLNNQEITEEIKEEIKKWCSKSSSKRKVYSNTILPQETRKISNKQSNLTPKGKRERRTNKTQS